jgi:hypothetical protein
MRRVKDFCIGERNDGGVVCDAGDGVVMNTDSGSRGKVARSLLPERPDGFRKIIAYNANGDPVSSFSTPDDDIKYLMWSKRKEGTPNDKALMKACQLLAVKK